MGETEMTAKRSPSGTSTDGGQSNTSRGMRPASVVREVAGLWKIWAVGLIFVAFAAMAYGMQGLRWVVEPFYLVFAVLTFGYGARRLKENLYWASR